MTTAKTDATAEGAAPRPTPFQITQIAAAAGADPRTVRRHLGGRRGASTTGARIDKALRDLGLEHLRSTGPSTSPPMSDVA